ncbi:histone-lysine N-methyltransferase Suv4-20-like [Phymastichus coffea]|uniref:histone-lysine N-methyltransferase Suv4-20-like n=1 Tax=Phymastichus coffea TaxID=108790 RepID=UPI00273C8289|nr:histone-lysine N-methyltransferase Suv4-20-like [Phymastichus coffea]
MDFSVTYTTKTKQNKLLIGPASLVNHDCKANSTCLWRNNIIYIKTKKNIKAGKEISCYYGPDFFDHKNKQCLCVTCEINKRGSYCTQEVNSTTQMQCHDEETVDFIKQLKIFDKVANSRSLKKTQVTILIQIKENFMAKAEKA